MSVTDINGGSFYEKNSVNSRTKKYTKYYIKTCTICGKMKNEKKFQKIVVKRLSLWYFR